MKSTPALLAAALCLACSAGTPDPPSTAARAPGGTAAAAPGETVRIGYLPIAASLPLYVALERRLFEAEGLVPEVSRFGSSDELGFAGSSGRVDVMSSLALNVAFDLGERTGQPFLLFSANTYSNRPGETVDYLVARKGSGIARTEDLAGKRVAAFPGSVSRILLLGMLARHGLTERDVAYTELPPKRWADALASGEVDAAFVMEPEATEIVERGLATTVVKGVIAEFFPDAPLSGHWVSAELAAGPRRGLVPRVVRVYRKALELIREHPAEVKLAYADHIGVSRKVASWIPLMRWTLGPDETARSVQAYADLLHQRGAIAARMEAARYLLGEPRSAAPQPPR